jgi:hypothetical protein
MFADVVGRRKDALRKVQRLVVAYSATACGFEEVTNTAGLSIDLHEFVDCHY